MWLPCPRRAMSEDVRGGRERHVRGDGRAPHRGGTPHPGRAGGKVFNSFFAESLAVSLFFFSFTLKNVETSRPFLVHRPHEKSGQIRPVDAAGTHI